jgi:hypothetical protein
MRGSAGRVCLELERCEHTQWRVTPLAIVEDLQVLEDGDGLIVEDVA